MDPGNSQITVDPGNSQITVDPGNSQITLDPGNSQITLDPEQDLPNNVLDAPYGIEHHSITTCGRMHKF